MKDDNDNDRVREFDTWSELYRTYLPGEYSLKKNRNGPFEGVVRTRRVSGLRAVEVGCANHYFQRTPRDIGRDDADYFTLSLLVSGQVTFSQNDREMRFSAGECALIDTRRPFSYAV